MILLPLSHYNDTIRESLQRRVHYAMGAKFEDHRAWPWKGTHVDCSGGVRAFLYRASRGAVDFPDGSMKQRAHCQEIGLPEWDYAEAANSPSSAAFIAFRNQTKGHAGHVWLVRYNLSWESYFGHGIGQRRAADAPLINIADYCFRIL